MPSGLACHTPMREMQGQWVDSVNYISANKRAEQK